MDQGSRGDEGVPLGTTIRQVQAGALSCNRGIDRQHAVRVGWQDLMIEPCTYFCPLRRIASFYPQHTLVQLQNGYSR